MSNLEVRSGSLMVDDLARTSAVTDEISARFTRVELARGV